MSAFEDRNKRLIETVQKHADHLLRFAQDPAGKTPLFVNALHASTNEPVRMDPDHVNKEALLASPASQQHWFRLLKGLSGVTGSSQYDNAMRSSLQYVFGHLKDESGLIYWGGHTAFNLEKQSIEFARDKNKVHELKMHYPDYALMWSVDPNSTKQYIEAVWNAHILDWSILDFNRHGPYNTPRGKVWNQSYQGGEVFFWGNGLTFVNAGSDLYYAAAMLSHLSGDSAPLEWAKRLAKRYIDTRQDGIGISGYQFSQSAGSWCDGPAVKGDRAQYQIAPLVPEGHFVVEGTIFKPRPPVQRCQLSLGEMLGDRGEAFVQWSCEEMAAWGRHAYRKSDNSFIPMLTDGYSLEGLVLDRKGYFGPQGKPFLAIPAGSEFFWMYAMGYRLSKDPFLWQMARDIGLGIGLGDIGEADHSSIVVWQGNHPQADHRVIYGLIDLYRATGNVKFLEFAHQTAAMLLSERFQDGVFVHKQTVYINDPLPLALLHLATALEEQAKVPAVFN